MTKRVWVYSDPHFGHANICKFVNYDGSKVRPWDDVDKMDEEMIQWYNELVSAEDRVYILGDVAFTVKALHQSVSRLNGRKILVPGNHDPKQMRGYINLFDDVRGYVQRDGFIMSHIPLHPGSLGRWRLNIHGHLHNNIVEEEITHSCRYGSSVTTYHEDIRYYCACVERTGFRPKLLDEILHERHIR